MDYRSYDMSIELRREHWSHQHRMRYFLMAGAGAAIAVAVSAVANSAWMWPHAVWLFSVLSWAVSFVSGYLYLDTVDEGYNLVVEKMRLSHAVDNNFSNSVQAEEMIEELNARAKIVSKKSGRWSARQFAFFAAGGVLFVAWKVVEMVSAAIAVLPNQ